MIVSVELTVKVSESGHNSYRDPNGFESVELVCVDEMDIEKHIDGIAAALTKVCFAKFRSELSKTSDEE